ncbi:MAG: C45 family peptidase [Dehalobacterium sp.]
MDARFIEVFGSPYERGFQSGKMFKKPLSRVVEKYSKLLMRDDLNKKVKAALDLSLSYCHDYVEEVMGKADGAGISFEVYWAMMCPEIIGETSHCTTIVMKRPDGSIILSHNEDDLYTKDSFCMTKLHTPNGWFVTNDSYNMPFGNGFSWNSHGIIKTINYCYEPCPACRNIPRYFLQRHISEAASIDDFIKRCSELPVASGFHAIVVDINLNRAVSVEVYPDRISTREIEDFYIHTNHYIHDKWKNNIQVELENNSLFRIEKASAIMSDLVATYEDNNNIPLESIQAILAYRGHDNTFKNSIWQSMDDPYYTVANFSWDSINSDKLDLSFYLTNEKVTLNYFDFNKRNSEKLFCDDDNKEI